MKLEYLKYLVLALLAVYIPLEARQHQDLDIFLLASKDLLQGGNIYEHSFESGFYFFYSPLFASALIPFTFLPVYVARMIWLALNLLAFFRTFKLIKEYLNFSSFSQKQRLLFDVICIVFSAKLIIDNFHNGQMTIFMLLFMLEGLRLIRSGHEIWGAALIALGINFKFLPLVLLPYLFYNKQLKACLYIAGWHVVFLYLPALVHGWDHNQALIRSWLGKVDPTQARHMIDTDETTLNGLSTWLPTLLMEKVPDVYALPLKRNILDLGPEAVGRIINIVRLALLAFTLYFLRRRIFTRPGYPMHALWELAYLFMLIPLLFPHQQHYAFFMIMPASVYLLYRVFVTLQEGRRVALGYWIILGAIYLLTNAHLLLGEFREYYDHYKVITYGALLAILALTLAKPGGELSKK